MTPSLTAAVAVLAAPAATLPTEVWPVTPEAALGPGAQPDPKRKPRAVLLIPGLKLHPLRPSRVGRPWLHEWQEPKSELVKTLAADFDVFAFGYAQTVPVDAVAHAPGLREAIARLRAAGYREVVLIGHSAGGLIARQFVECYPEAGVTKVIQVATPNQGTELAAVIKAGYPRVHAAFIQSLAPGPRAEAARRSPRQLAAAVEAVCVVCKVRVVEGDGVVPLPSQWPADLQSQGVPASLIPVNHIDVMKSPASVRMIAELARGPLTRWTPEQTDRARKVLFRESDDR